MSITVENEDLLHGEFISFVFSSSTGKTDVWRVQTRDQARLELGYVSWFGRWRCYAFFPLNDTVYEQKCLRDIAEFCETKTKNHRQLRSKIRKALGAK